MQYDQSLSSSSSKLMLGDNSDTGILIVLSARRMLFRKKGYALCNEF